MPAHPPKCARILAVASALVIALATGTSVATAAPPPDSSSEAAQRLRELAREAEALTEDYKEAQENHRTRERELSRAETAAERARRAAERARAEQEALRGEVDELTAAAYTGGGSNQLSALITSRSPEQYLDRASILAKLASERGAAVRSITEATRRAETSERRARAARDDAAKAAAEAERLEDRIARRKRAMSERIAEVERQYDRLTRAERAALAADGSTGVGAISGSGAAVEAVNIALGKQGSPYVWGAKGPNSFDCSGLVQWSYAQAGVDLPASTRTQIDAGRAVDLDRMKPGDVVFYYDSASHNGLYIGGGEVVHAPTTGQTVKVEHYTDIGDVHSVRRMVG
ncbi:NlpC/P60 family protein [Actinopolyspora sp. H202]|uniref:C40 family peptidase n=1 Tax=Actinopolyspora sp. H202 TaxID=1500456 RepID=UPI003EE51A12